MLVPANAIPVGHFGIPALLSTGIEIDLKKLLNDCIMIAPSKNKYEKISIAGKKFSIGMTTRATDYLIINKQ